MRKLAAILTLLAFLLGAHFWVVQHGDRPEGRPARRAACQPGDALTTQQMWDVIDYIKQIAAGTASG